MRLLSVFILFCLQVTCLFGQTDINGVSLDNIHYVDEGVYRSEQPDEIGFKELEKFGVKEVLNLRYWHNNKDEINGGGANIISHRVRMNAHNITNKAVIEALRIIKNRKGPIIFHCRHGSDRTGTIAAMYRIVFQNWSKEKALEELKREEYGHHKIFFNIPKYIKNVDVELIRREVFKE